jgi:hypothetical protein
MAHKRPPNAPRGSRHGAIPTVGPPAFIHFSPLNASFPPTAGNGVLLNGSNVVGNNPSDTSVPSTDATQVCFHFFFLYFFLSFFLSFFSSSSFVVACLQKKRWRWKLFMKKFLHIVSQHHNACFFVHSRRWLGWSHCPSGRHSRLSGVSCLTTSQFCGHSESTRQKKKHIKKGKKGKKITSLKRFKRKISLIHCSSARFCSVKS